jgi:hypothetical protein
MIAFPERTSRKMSEQKPEKEHSTYLTPDYLAKQFCDFLGDSLSRMVGYALGNATNTTNRVFFSIQGMDYMLEFNYVPSKGQNSRELYPKDKLRVTISSDLFGDKQMYERWEAGIRKELVPAIGDIKFRENLERMFGEIYKSAFQTLHGLWYAEKEMELARRNEADSKSGNHIPAHLKVPREDNLDSICTDT